MPSENTLAVFIDFENLALGFEGRRNTKFDVQKVLGRLVEKGKIKSAIKNFRFNESPVIMLNNVAAMSPEVRVTGSEGGGFSTLMPALKVDNFTFTSLSDAV